MFPCLEIGQSEDNQTVRILQLLVLWKVWWLIGISKIVTGIINLKCPCSLNVSDELCLCWLVSWLIDCFFGALVPYPTSFDSYEMLYWWKSFLLILEQRIYVTAKTYQEWGKGGEKYQEFTWETCMWNGLGVLSPSCLRSNWYILLGCRAA